MLSFKVSFYLPNHIFMFLAVNFSSISALEILKMKKVSVSPVIGKDPPKGQHFKNWTQ